MDMQQLEISTTANEKVRGNLFTNTEAGKHPGILLIHGWRSGQDRYFDLAQKLFETGFTVLSFDLRGHRSSEGDINKLTREDFLADVISAYDTLASLPNVDAGRITVIGSSFGGYLASILTTKRNFKNLILRVPADYPNMGFASPLMRTKKLFPLSFIWKRVSRSPRATFALDAIHHFFGNILIVESEKDETIPHRMIANYINAVSDKKQLTHIVMKGAPHSLRKHPQLKKEFEEITLKWLADK